MAVVERVGAREAAGRVLWGGKAGAERAGAATAAVVRAAMGCGCGGVREAVKRAAAKVEEAAVEVTMVW